MGRELVEIVVRAAGVLDDLWGNEDRGRRWCLYLAGSKLEKVMSTAFYGSRHMRRNRWVRQGASEVYELAKGRICR